MIWLFLRLAILALVMAVPNFRTHQAELTYLTVLLSFDLLWLSSRRIPELRLLATLFFSLLLGTTAMVFLVGGSPVSLAFFWPSLMLRLEDRPAAEQRLYLVAAQIALLATVPASLYPADLLRVGPLVLSALQVRGGRLAGWANSAALAWMLGPVVQASFAPDAFALTRVALLLALPQLGLRRLQHD
jgi:hypothetical protein